ncbi:transposase [Vibrio profundum]|uniref:hypothetical protein n=1 Tax=Vibrio profundum TaxID=2910247 RepID=UPI003D117508
MLAITDSTITKNSVNNVNPAVITGCIDTLQQGASFLAKLSEEEYTVIIKPHFISSIGEHFRHILDVFHAIMHANHAIDYNQRRRGHEVERYRHSAEMELSGVIHWLKSKNEPELLTPVSVITEVSPCATKSCEMGSTLGRELTFAALHATHHYALTKIMAGLLGSPSDNSFGIAPATATHIRGQ